ncbi:unnamed protein product [Dibothriocephalus latus]|uniref:Receptor ligand binding region domain-containing protein n=1 Tax=Dibothriocephalus latus TaxID=60516 RepID=A0A3P7L3R8_DIBLA|nr:unnamed protein product [Dibothriocephalus latus]
MFMLTLDKTCLPESAIFDLNSTLKSTINYTCFRSNASGCGFEVQLNLHSIQGCSLRAQRRDQNLVEYCCRLDSLFRLSANVYSNRFRSHECCQIASLSVAVQAHTLVTALHTFFAFKHWENIAIVYEVSQLNLHAAVLAETIQLFLSRIRDSSAELNAFIMLSLHWDTDPRVLMKQLGTDCEAIILLARPPMSVSFLSAISDMPLFLDGRIAIIQLDPSGAITYDVLRFWKMVLSNASALGAAGQCLYIMTALPAGTGYSADSPILTSVRECCQQRFFRTSWGCLCMRDQGLISIL